MCHNAAKGLEIWGISGFWIVQTDNTAYTAFSRVDATVNWKIGKFRTWSVGSGENGKQGLLVLDYTNTIKARKKSV